MNLHQLTIAEAHKGLVEKKFTATELTDACLAHSVAVEPNIHAYLAVHEERARAQAAAVDARIARGEDVGPLAGIPLVIKDNMLIQGTRATAGSKILETYISSYDATVIAKLKAQDAVLLGKTNCDEFAMGTSTENSAYGPTGNPWDPSRVPGGSSGGSAAAVAANECIAALGSDTGGSIRQPAGMCGVVGLKPTYGAVSRYGLIAMASSLDQIGPITKTVEDAAFLFDAIKGPDVHDSSSAFAPTKPVAMDITQPIKGMKIGIPTQCFIDGLDPDIERSVREAIDVLRGLGAEIIDVELATMPYALSVYYLIQPAEVSANLARFDGIRYGTRTAEAKDLNEMYCKSRTEGLGAEPRRRIMLGTYALSSGYYDAYYKKAQAVRELVRRDFANAFRMVDCVVMPTSPNPAFRIGEKANDPLSLYLEDVFTVSANIAGIPGLAVPCGFTEVQGSRLPVGMQFLGRHFDEATILRAGYAYEQATDWHFQKSSLS